MPVPVAVAKRQSLVMDQILLFFRVMVIGVQVIYVEATPPIVSLTYA